MAQVSPWHKAKSPTVYHDNTACHLGNNIERRNRRSGRAGLRLCDECRRVKGKRN